MIPTPFHDLVSTVDLFEEDEESEWVWHDEIGNFESLMGNICKNLEIEPVASSDDKGDIFARIFRFFEHFTEFTCLHTFSSFIEQYDPSFHLFERFYDSERFLDFYIFRIGVRNGFYRLQSDHFLCSFSVFWYRFTKMFESVGDGEDRNHRHIIQKNEESQKNFLTRGLFFIQSAHVPP